MPDTELIQQLKQGSEQAFKTLVDNYRKMVVNTCYGIVQNRDDAEDIAQDVFVEVYRNIDGFRADSKLSTWLYRIAVNRSLNHLRDHKKHRWLTSFEAEVSNKSKALLQAASPVTDEPGYELENRQRAVLLHEAIDSLPQKQKVAFILNKYEELSYNEIAGVMEMSVSSVESLLFRAKKNLQKKLFRCYQKKCI